MRASCSVRLCVRRDSLVEVMFVGEVPMSIPLVVEKSSSRSAAWRERSVDCGSEGSGMNDVRMGTGGMEVSGEL